MPYTHARAYFQSTYDSISRCVTEQDHKYLYRLYDSNEMGPNELTLLVNLIYHNDGVVQINRQDICFIIVRDNGFECNRVKDDEACFNACTSLRDEAGFAESKKAQALPDPEGRSFTFEFEFHNEKFGHVARITNEVEVTTLNYKRGFEEFCGRVRTDRGYLVPCHDFYVDIKEGIEGYNSFLEEGSAFDGGFTDWLGDPSVSRNFYIEKSELYIRAEKEGWSEPEVEAKLEEIKNRLGFSYSFKVKDPAAASNPRPRDELEEKVRNSPT